MSRPAIRPATRSDLPGLLWLYEEFHAFHVRGVPDRLRIPAEPRPDAEFVEAAQAILADEGAVLLVAENGGELVGFAEVYVRDEAASPRVPARRYGHLQSLGVTEGARRRGIGRLLLAEAEQWAASQGASEIRTDTWEFGGGPLPFYERRGCRTVRRTLVKALS